MKHSDNRIFNYSDGEAIETIIYDIVKTTSDKSYNSIELAKNVNNWPEYYHLSIGRANIIDCLNLPADSTVLEVGSGCGAITRYLGENFKEVIGIEGSELRSKIAKLRCSDLENVSIIQSNLQDLDIELKFDYIFVIGVMEYAPLYIEFEGENVNACINFIKLCKKFLKPEGSLVTAIENKLGLKYWNGAKEDHGQGIYSGINDYNNNPGPITFSYKELNDLFSCSGLSHNKIYGAMPDYKFATTLFNTSKPLHNPFTWIKPESPDPNNRYVGNFNEVFGYKSLHKANLFNEFLNSYLIVSSPSIHRMEETWSVICYNQFRNTDLQTKVISDGEKVIKQRLNSKFEKDHHDFGEFIHSVGEKDLIKGNVLTFLVIDDLINNRNSRLIKHYLENLVDKFRTGKSEGNIDILSGDSFDYTFPNIIIKDNIFYFIDDEWKFKREFPADYVLFRSILRGIKPFFHLFKIKTGFKQFRINLINQYYPNYNRKRDEYFFHIEKEIMHLLNIDQLGILKSSKTDRVKVLIKNDLVRSLKDLINKMS